MDLKIRTKLSAKEEERWKELESIFGTSVNTKILKN